jgi:hypothetical protein
LGVSGSGTALRLKQLRARVERPSGSRLVGFGGAVAGLLFAAGAVFLLARRLRAAAVCERLERLGFESCDDQREALERVYSEVTGQNHARLSRCHVSRRGRRPVFRVEVLASDVGGVPGPAAYVVELADANVEPSGAVSVYLARNATSAQRALARLRRSLRGRPRLDLPAAVAADGAGSIVSAFGSAPGPLEGAVSDSALARLGRAPARGILAAHFAAGRVALLVDACAAPEPHLDYLAEWA